jgi:predicted hotdog family 3-hydroxylacyl-ACP dehydratase
MMLNRAAVAALIPHRGAMCLLDGVEFWDRQRIICTSMQHRSRTNPLRTAAGLSALHGVEFAAQAVAAHGSLTAMKLGTAPSEGLLLSVRDCVFHRRRLDDIGTPLVIDAQQLGNNDATRLYRFSVSGQHLAVEGRVAVMLREGTS